MPDTVATASIAAAASIVAAAITATIPPIMQRRNENKRYSTSKRADGLKGIWDGGGEDFYTEESTDKLAFELKLELQVKGKKVEGRGYLKTVKSPLIVNGGFLSEDYVQLTYENSDHGVRQMGVIVFRLSGDSQVLNGNYAGYSPRRDIFVAGIVRLTKTV